MSEQQMKRDLYNDLLDFLNGNISSKEYLNREQKYKEQLNRKNMNMQRNWAHLEYSPDTNLDKARKSWNDKIKKDQKDYQYMINNINDYKDNNSKKKEPLKQLSDIKYKIKGDYPLHLTDKALVINQLNKAGSKSCNVILQFHDNPYYYKAQVNSIKDNMFILQNGNAFNYTEYLWFYDDGTIKLLEI
jgi:hypothetical protein